MSVSSALPPSHSRGGSSFLLASRSRGTSIQSPQWRRKRDPRGGPAASSSRLQAAVVSPARRSARSAGLGWGVGVGGRKGGGSGGGVRGGAVPLLEPVPASAPGSRTPRGKKEEWRVRSQGFLIQPGAAGGRRSFGAAGRPSLPGSSRSSAPGTCRLSLAETRSGGGESRLGPPLTGGATPAGGRRRRSRPPLAALERMRGGGRRAGKRRRSGCVR